ncbi:MAG: Ni/Fe hydrogenase subunit alpha [Bryobacteraceae bacterium]|nr:Ni/Fe hydrogenase subunit alpha [Bryobacteraceae bacterium]
MTKRTLVIDPVTRIEGHSKITIQLDEQGRVADARFHVTQFRGFEKICENRPFHEMPALMARICGICPVSHLITSAKACDAILAVAVPKTAVHLRRILNLAQILQSHALSLFHLSSPDLLLGMDSDPLRRNLFGLAQTHPEVARDGIRLRQVGQTIIEILGGKRIHPAWVVPGGVSAPLTAEKRDQIRDLLPEGLVALNRRLDQFKELFAQFPEEVDSFAHFPSLFLGLVDDHGDLEHYNGPARVIGSGGAVVKDGFAAGAYPEYIGEINEHDSYLKSAYYKPFGYPDGIYRVGPLARLNIARRCGTPRADRELEDLRALSKGPALASFHYHQARMVEMLFCLERIEQLLNEPAILDTHVRAQAAVNAEEGIAMAEAPRGLLLHHYKVDRDGLVRWANLIIATGHNNLAMNRGVLQTAQRFVDGERLTEGALNRVEAVIRAFDPCLSCSTHAYGQMPLEVELRDVSGGLLDVRRR